MRVCVECVCVCVVCVCVCGECIWHGLVYLAYYSDAGSGHWNRCLAAILCCVKRSEKHFTTEDTQIWAWVTEELGRAAARTAPKLLRVMTFPLDLPSGKVQMHTGKNVGSSIRKNTLKIPIYTLSSRSDVQSDIAKCQSIDNPSVNVKSQIGSLGRRPILPNHKKRRPIWQTRKRRRPGPLAKWLSRTAQSLLHGRKGTNCFGPGAPRRCAPTQVESHVEE